MTFKKNIDELRSLSNSKWQGNTAENIFLERDREIDLELRNKDISHYVGRKYINILWGSEYDYDLS